MDSYLDRTFLGDLADDMGDDIGAEMATVPMSAAAGERQIAQPEYITLPGGIIMEKKTFFMLVAVVAGIAIYLYTKKQKKADAE